MDIRGGKKMITSNDKLTSHTIMTRRRPTFPVQFSSNFCPLFFVPLSASKTLECWQKPLKHIFLEDQNRWYWKWRRASERDRGRGIRRKCRKIIGNGEQRIKSGWGWEKVFVLCRHSMSSHHSRQFSSHSYRSEIFFPSSATHIRMPCNKMRKAMKGEERRDEWIL